MHKCAGILCVFSHPRPYVCVNVHVYRYIHIHSLNLALCRTYQHNTYTVDLRALCTRRSRADFVDARGRGKYRYSCTFVCLFFFCVCVSVSSRLCGCARAEEIWMFLDVCVSLRLCVSVSPCVCVDLSKVVWQCGFEYMRWLRLVGSLKL